MRQIKFEYGFESVNGLVKKTYHLHEIPNIKDKCDVWNVLPIVYVREFTGLHDKNGLEIYEGDIIEGQSYLYGYELKDNKQFYYKGIVEFETQCDVGLCWIVNNGSGSWNLNQTVHRNMIDYCTGQVIGNIYENPELLN